MQNDLQAMRARRQARERQEKEAAQLKNKKKEKPFVKTILYAVGIVALALGGGAVGGRLAIANAPAQPALMTYVTSLFEKEPEEFIVNFEPFITNLVSEGKPNVMQVAISMQVLGEDNNERLEKKQAKVRDAILHTLSTESIKTVYETTESGRYAIKDKMKQSVNALFDEEVVQEVLITDIITQ